MNKKKQKTALEFRSLLCVFTALKGSQITIELRSNCKIYGTIENVDKYMNIELSNVNLKNKFFKNEKFEILLVQSRNIRYIHIPDKIDLNNLLYVYSRTLSDNKKKYQRTKRKAMEAPKMEIYDPTKN
ncbi:hypothetical protein DLAC_11582 [Tieghemostelium lacteum]|uniref:Sm domain-containing protein n=1 Tax=Tieghemostelium lacteum TaxID=361077 RepID=A0A151ZJ71_TIELA|nr:hypothetical protein DLAC_11582 [Tieghemostelium lacteum]|eukprot:KYQ94048.1 hypothetical protein DLAC_11582 [Tieghemostelium lacteum]